MMGHSVNPGSPNTGRRKRRLAACAAAAALVFSACSGTPLASVDGVAIDRSDLIAYDASYRDAADTDPAQLRNDVANLVVLQIMSDAAATDYGIAVAPDEVAGFFAAPPEGFEAAAARLAAEVEAGEVPAGVADATVTSFLLRQAVLDRLVSEGTDTLIAEFEGRPARFLSGCIRHIVVPTQEEAEAARERIVAGESFADVAASVSLDTSPGGVILNQETGQCELSFGGFAAGAEALGEAAADLAIGEPSEVISTEFGWHVIVVDSRTGPESADELAADPEAYAPPGFGDALFNTWLQEAFTAADVEIDPAVGTWQPAQGGVVPAGS